MKVEGSNTGVVPVEGSPMLKSAMSDKFARVTVLGVLPNDMFDMSFAESGPYSVWAIREATIWS
ncbi:unnamed protein product [Prunus armeniaca]